MKGGGSDALKPGGGSDELKFGGGFDRSAWIWSGSSAGAGPADDADPPAGAGAGAGARGSSECGSSLSSSIASSLWLTSPARGGIVMALGCGALASGTWWCSGSPTDPTSPPIPTPSRPPRKPPTMPGCGTD